MAAPTLFAAGALAAVASGTTITPVIPAADAANDILFMELMCNAATTFSLPADWNSFGFNESSANMSSAFYWKRGIGGAEPNPSITTSVTMSSTIGGYGRIYVIRGCVTVGPPFDAAIIHALDLTTHPDTEAITTLGIDRLVCSYALIDDDNTLTVQPPTLWSMHGSNLTSVSGGDACSTALEIAAPTATTIAQVEIGTMANDYCRSLTVAWKPIPPALTLPVTENWTGTDGDIWDSNTWKDIRRDAIYGGATKPADLDAVIDGNAGQMRAIGTSDYPSHIATVNTVPLDDFELLIKWAWQAPHEKVGNGIIYHCLTQLEVPEAYPDSAWVIGDYVHDGGAGTGFIGFGYYDGSGVYTELFNEVIDNYNTTFRWLRILVEGTRHRGRWWDDGDTEPGTWSWDITDSLYQTAGSVILTFYTDDVGTEAFCVWDSLSITDISSGTPETIGGAWGVKG